jgi:hypothetical protein
VFLFVQKYLLEGWIEHEDSWTRDTEGR